MNKRVLIVDDSLTVRMDLRDAFEAASFATVLCATIAEARIVVAREPIALAILDVVLPDGDGVELLHELRTNSALAGLPILMLSEEAEIQDRIRGLQTGADDYVGKPYDAGYIVARARELMRARESPARKATTLLVIDDSTTFREALREAFETAGYVVITAASGEEGLRAAATHRPNAVIVDGVLPGIDGATVVRRIRLDAVLRDTPCLLLTGSDDSGAEIRALDAGADAFVSKEQDLDVVLARLGAMLRSASGPGRDVNVARAPKRLLIVDDSETYLQTVSSLLRNEGYDVVIARSGEAALELLAAQSVECILLDRMMPGLSGKETCQRIKAAPAVRDIPIIMVTALDDRQAMIEGLDAGADDYVPKSSDFEVLRARVFAQIRRKQLEDENRRTRERLLRSELQAAEERAARELAETRSVLVEELERKNRELEAFSYSVSHDLRAPLRSIDGFSQLLLTDCSAALDETGRDYLQRVLRSTKRMGQLIDDLLALARVSRAELRKTRVDISALARSVVDDIRRGESERDVLVEIEDGLSADADGQLLRVVLENLLGNAWKFTTKASNPRIAVGCTEREGQRAFFVRDNGAGFDMDYAQKLFAPFQRLHSELEFPGTGIGLATVYRIVDRHGGRITAEGEVGKGATLSFTLASATGDMNKSCVKA